MRICKPRPIVPDISRSLGTRCHTKGSLHKVLQGAVRLQDQHEKARQRLLGGHIFFMIYD